MSKSKAPRSAPAEGPPRPSPEHVIEMAELVAHEVNNLLNNILLHLAVMDRKSPEGGRAELAVIRQAGTRAGAIINRWQQLAPREVPELGPVDLNRVAGDAVAAWQPPAPGPVVRFEPAPGLSPALAEPRELGRLVHLLLANAAAAAGQGTVTVRTEETPSDLVLAVEDTGPALDPAAQERLFEPFYVARAAETVADAGAPSEVGLALCKKLARRQQGSIAADNRPGGGVRVEVRLRKAAEEG
jgi:signal transduction histidine kinase